MMRLAGARRDVPRPRVVQPVPGTPQGCPWPGGSVVLRRLHCCSTTLPNNHTGTGGERQAHCVTNRASCRRPAPSLAGRLPGACQVECRRGECVARRAHTRRSAGRGGDEGLGQFPHRRLAVGAHGLHRAQSRGARAGWEVPVDVEQAPATGSASCAASASPTTAAAAAARPPASPQRREKPRLLSICPAGPVRRVVPSASSAATNPWLGYAGRAACPRECVGPQAPSPPGRLNPASRRDTMAV